MLRGVRLSTLSLNAKTKLPLGSLARSTALLGLANVSVQVHSSGDRRLPKLGGKFAQKCCGSMPTTFHLKVPQRQVGLIGASSERRTPSMFVRYLLTAKISVASGFRRKGATTTLHHATLRVSSEA